MQELLTQNGKKQSGGIKEKEDPQESKENNSRLFNK